MITATAPKTTISILLRNAADHLKFRVGWERTYDYNDLKAAQLLYAKADLFVAEAQIESWFVDLGFDGQCQPDSSIGGIECYSSLEIS